MIVIRPRAVTSCKGALGQEYVCGPLKYGGVGGDVERPTEAEAVLNRNIVELVI